MGQAFGEACRDDIHTFYTARVNNAVDQAWRYGGRRVHEDDLVAVARASLPHTEAFDARGYAELCGIAEGANLPVEKILAMNGLTDYRDILAWAGPLETFGGCSSFIAQRDATASGDVICGQTWDLATDNMPYVLGVVRHPDEGPVTRCLTTVGCLSLIGQNEHGVSIGTTNVRTFDARPGVNYLSLIHAGLAEKTAEAAAQRIENAHRAGAHTYFIADKAGASIALEVSAERNHRFAVDAGSYVHCNHCLAQVCIDIETDTPTNSTHARQPRMEALMKDAHGRIDEQVMIGILGDHENGDNAICRHGANGISTNGAVVMNATAGTIFACHGPACESTWIPLHDA